MTIIRALDVGKADCLFEKLPHPHTQPLLPIRSKNDAGKALKL